MISCKIGRQLAIRYYMFLLIILVFETIFCLTRGQHYYLLVFLVNATTYILGLICAAKYKIHTEKKILTLCIYFGLCNVFVRSHFIFSYDVWMSISVISINVLNLIWFYYRRKCIKLLIRSLSEKVVLPCMRH